MNQEEIRWMLHLLETRTIPKGEIEISWIEHLVEKLRGHSRPSSAIPLRDK